MTMVWMLVGGFVGGLVLQYWIINQFHRLAVKSRWKWDDLFWPAFGNMPFLLSACFGLYAALGVSSLDGGYRALLHRMLMGLILFMVTLVSAKLAGGVIQLLSSQVRGWLPSTTLLVSGTRLLVYIAGGVIILQNLGIQITPIITALGLGGLAVALALQDTLNNLFSGVQIIASALVRPGDYVKLDSGHEGYVTDVKARSTTIRAFPDNNRIIVPNSTMTSAIVINYSLPVESLWLSLEVGVSYASDLDHVERVTLEVAADVMGTVEGGMSEHQPVFRYQQFADSSITFRLRMFVKKFEDQFLIQHEFIKRLHRRYSEESIEIPFPIRTLYMGDRSDGAKGSDAALTLDVTDPS